MASLSIINCFVFVKPVCPLQFRYMTPRVIVSVPWLVEGVIFCL